MRVIAGEARSLNLITPKGMDVRPTTDRTKETLFNMIHELIPGSIFLDIFSGSGAIGIEALSRGSKKAFFVEMASLSVDCIQKNLNHTKLFDRAEILHLDYLRAISSLSEQKIKFNLIFLDPPYNQSFEQKAITAIWENQLLEEDGLIICESFEQTDFDFVNQLKGFVHIKTKAFKTNKFTFIEGMSE